MTDTQKKLAKAGHALLSARGMNHKRPKKPTKRDLSRKFRLTVDRKGKPSMVEVE